MLVSVTLLSVALFCSSLNAATTDSSDSVSVNVAMVLDWSADVVGSCLKDGSSVCPDTSILCSKTNNPDSALCPLGPFYDLASCCDACFDNPIPGRSCCKSVDETDACSLKCIVAADDANVFACMNSPCGAVGMPFCKAYSAFTVATEIPIRPGFIMLEDNGNDIKTALRFSMYPLADNLVKISGSALSSNWTASREFANLSLIPDIKSLLFGQVYNKYTKDFVRNMNDAVAYSSESYGFPSTYDSLLITVVEKSFGDKVDCEHLKNINIAARQSNIYFGVMIRSTDEEQISLSNCLSELHPIVLTKNSIDEMRQGVDKLISYFSSYIATRT